MSRIVRKYTLLIILCVKTLSSQYNFRVSENQLPNTSVGQVLIKSGYLYEFFHKEGLFNLNKHTGLIFTRKIIDRESLISDLIEIFLYKKTLEGQYLETISIKVRIIDENDNPPLFYPNKLERHIIENIALLTDISLSVATDSDTDEFGVSNNYKIESGNEDERFILAGVGVQYRGQLLLRVVRPLDREMRDKYHLKISVEDKGQPPLKGILEVEIVVEDYNDNSPVFSPSKYTVRLNESNLPGFEVVKVYASDADAGVNKQVEYRFKKTRSVSENEFSIDRNSGSIRLTRPTNCHISQGDCTLVVEAFDHGSPSLSAYCYVTIQVIRINSFFPRFRINYVGSTEKAAYIEMGKVTRKPLAIIHCQDDDQDPRDLIAVSIIRGNDENLFSLERTHGNVHILRQIKSINNINVQSYDITIRAVDNGNPSKQTNDNILIKVNKANICPPIFRNRYQSVTVFRNASINSFIANFFATDQDTGLNGKIIYSITNGESRDLFMINKESGLITLFKPLSFLKLNKIKLEITARDSGINSLEVTGYLDVKILQSHQLFARIKSTCQTHFILTEFHLHHSINHILIQDFTNQLELSDEQRVNEVEFIIINQQEILTDFFISSNGSFYLSKHCRNSGIEILILAILYQSNLINKTQISIEITPKISNMLCNPFPVIYSIKLPDIFQYNTILFEIPNFQTRQFDGEFKDISINNNAYFVSSDGIIYWRTNLPVIADITKLEIKYVYVHFKQTLSQNIIVIIYPFSAEKALIDCMQLHSVVLQRPHTVQLENFRIEYEQNLEFFLPANISGKYIQIIDKNINFQRLFYSSYSAPTDFQVLGYSSKYFSRCFINIPLKSRFEFEKYYFKTNQNVGGAAIGKIRVMGNTSSVLVNVTGKTHQKFYYSIQEEMIFLKDTFMDTNVDGRIIEIRLDLFDLLSGLLISDTVIIIEFLPLLSSPVFSEPFYTFVVRENSLSHIPLQKINLIQSKKLDDYNLSIIDESLYGKWSIFSDGSLYLLSELDYEDRKKYSFTVLASNKKDKEKSAKVLVNILVEDCNDNVPRFSALSYFFIVNRYAKLNTTIGKVFAMDSDSGLNGFLNYSIETLPIEVDFVEIDSRSGRLFSNKMVDLIEEEFNFFVRASDYGIPSLNSSVKIYVKINSNLKSKLSFERQIYFRNISENTEIGQEVFNPQIDPQRLVTFKLSKCTQEGIFSINKHTGIIHLMRRLDRELLASHTLTMLISDNSETENSENLAVANLYITIKDVNDNSPIFEKNLLNNFILQESTKIGTILGFYVAEDIDEGLNGEVRYQLSATGTDGISIFKIDVFSGALYLNQPLDYEYKSKWNFIITAFDMGYPQRHTNLSMVISVTNNNDEKPRFNKDVPMEFTVQQNVAIGTTVGRVNAQDPDINEVLYYLQSVHPPDHPFVINPSSGILSISNSILHQDLFHLVILAVDVERQELYDQQSIKVHIKYDNEDEIQMFTYGAIVLPKSAFYGEKIATLRAKSISKNSNSKFMYLLKNSSYDKLIINRHTGDVFLTSNSPVEFNSVDMTFLISLESLRTDSLIKYHTTKLILNHGEPHNLNFQKNDYFFKIPECKTSPGLKLFRLQALYPGNPISDLEYYIFDIYCGISERIRLPSTIIKLDKESGWLSVGNKYLDREMIEGSQITLEVVVIDRGKNGSRIRSTKVFLNIDDCNDNRPVFPNETFIFHVPENTTFGQRLYVGTVQAHDNDLDSMLEYNWIKKIPEFSVDKTSGVITTSGIPFDYESVRHFIQKIQVSDGKFTSTANVIILIDDANDQCHNFSSKHFDFQIKENSPINTIIGQVTLSNYSTNRNSIIKFAVISEWGKHQFSVNPDHGIITTQGDIDYEQDNHYILLITATDISKQSLFLPCDETVTATVLVSIVNINDNIPMFDTSRLSVSIPENIPINSEIFQLLATDADKSDLLQFEILSPNDDLFTVNPITGAISTARILDYEKTETHVLTVSCFDGLHRAIVEVSITLINVNDENPVIHNPTIIYLSNVSHKQNIIIKCSDQDNLDALSYDITASSKEIQFIRINHKTGKVSFNPKLFDSGSINVSLSCSDTIHHTIKNVSLKVLNLNKFSKDYTAHIKLETFETSFIKIHDFVGNLAINNYKFVYFLFRSKYISYEDDFNFYHLNPSSAYLRPIQGFIPRKHEYRFSVTAIKWNSLENESQINIETVLTYKKIELCIPNFIGTPYLFQIDYRIISPKFLGSVSVGYCPNQKILYYLNSGHSFFSVNGTNGELFITKNLPLGQYKFKLSSQIDTNPTTSLSTIVTVLTVGPRVDIEKCEFVTLRLILDSTIELGAKLGKVKIKNLSDKVHPIFYKLSHNRPLSITNDGDLILSSKSLKSNYFNLSAKVSWWDRNEHKILNCPIELNISPRTSNCVLGVAYSNTNIEIHTFFDQMNGNRFLFGIPIAHRDCHIQQYNSQFELNDPNFYISHRTGEIFSRKILTDSMYKIMVRISSINSINSIDVPVTILVVNMINNVKIEFNTNEIPISLFWKTSVKSVVTSVKANVVPSSYQSVLEYSLVYFCCIYSTNVAIYNSSIHQIFFTVNRESGDITLNEPLPKLNTIYTLRIRTSLKMENPKKLIYKDIDVSISVHDIDCKFNNPGFFTGSIEENSDAEVIVTRNILTCNKKDKVTITLLPKWIQDYLYYNSETNEIRSAHKPLDREVQENLEIKLVITDQLGNFIDSSPGIIKVIDLNDNSPIFTLNYFMGFVSEDASVGTWIIDIGVVDADSKLFPLKFNLQGEKHSLFSINPQNGSVFLAQTVNREERSKYELKVAVSDEINVLEIGMLITVMDVNDNRPEISKEIINQTFVINMSEFEHGNLFITNITATDADDPQSNNSQIRYSLLSDNQRIPVKSLFLLDEDSGSLIITSDILNWLSDNETVEIYITASDRGQPPLSHSVITHFLFINVEYELKISNGTFKHPIAVLYTNQDGSRVANIAVDNDKHFSDISFRIISSNGSSFFSIDSKSGQISTTRNVNSAVIGVWFSLIIQACGYKRLSSILFCSKRETITFVISDFNLYSPQIRISETTISVSEAIKVGSNILQIDVIDPDVGLSGIVKLIIMTHIDRKFSLVSSPSNGNSFQLTISNSLDYETQRQYSLTLLAHDLGFPRRSQTSIVIVNVLDEDDNEPYFTSHNFVVSMRELDQIIILPEIRDEDSIMASGNEHKYILKTKSSSVVQLFQSKNNLTLKIIKTSENESVINLSLEVFGMSRENYPKSLPVGRYSTVKIYLVLPKLLQSQIQCLFKEIDSVNHIKYIPTNPQSDLIFNLLTISPKLSKQLIIVDRNTGHISIPQMIQTSNIFISVSMVTAKSYIYKICQISRITSSMKVTVNDIIIEKNFKSKQIVGKILINSNPQVNINDINLRIYSSQYLPFFIKTTGEVVTTDNLFLDYPTFYTVLLRSTSKVNEFDSAITHFSIKVNLNHEKKRGLSISINVRENIGDGAILGSVQTLLENNFLQRSGFMLSKESFDPTGHLLVDRKGIIRIRKSIDKESNDPLSINIFMQYNTQSEFMLLSVTVNDENDSESKPKIADIFINIVENAYQLTRIVRLLPIDPDIHGDYQCRLETLNVPFGVLITPDCWLHFVNTSAIRLMNNSQIRIIHHDGYHKAVISTFRLKVNSLNNRSIQMNWIVFKISKIFHTSMVNNLEIFKAFLLTLHIDVTLMAIEPSKNYLVVWPASAKRQNVLQVLERYKEKLELELKVKIREITIELCHKKLCNFHGLCSIETKIIYDQIFTNENFIINNSIHLYPVVNFQFKCLCDDGFIGERCNLLSKCRQQICHNGGICGINNHGDAICECAPGYTGFNCEYDINECENVNLCTPHGNCNNILGGYKCECQLNWIGNNLCTQPIDHCSSNPCSELGTKQCIPILGGFKCRCYFGYYGDRCQHSALSLPAESYMEIDFQTIPKISIEFSTISKDTPLITIFISSSIIIQVSLSFGCIRLSIFEDSALISQRDSNKVLSTGSWWKLDVNIHPNNVLVSVIACKEWNQCEYTIDQFRMTNRRFDVSLSMGTIGMDSSTIIKVFIGSIQKLKLPGMQYFVGCVRNLQLHNSSAIRNEHINVLYDSCPRYIHGLLPCSNPEINCGTVGKCVDEWFVSRCECPSGYQPPFCTPGYSAFALAPNTVISFMKRPKSASSNRNNDKNINNYYYLRKKRAISPDYTMISIRIKTKDSNSIIFMALTSHHSYTLVQLENGLVKVIDKYAGSYQEMLHKVVPVNDNKIHTITVARHSTGTVSVTVDFVVAQVNWLQSHDILGHSVNEIYLAGLPDSKKMEYSLNFPNFIGCISDLRFNNKTMPLKGLSENFNVSIIQGSITSGCSSDICRQSNLCEKNQKCQEIDGVPHGIWGQYKCVDDNKYRLLTILLPVVILICVILIIMIVIFTKRCSKKRKSKILNDSSNTEVLLRKMKPSDFTDFSSNKKFGHIPRSLTASAGKQEHELRNICHPDLISSHEVSFEPCTSLKPKSKLESRYRQDSTFPNQYISSDHQSNNQKFFNSSSGTLKTEDSLIYQCSRPDEYEAVGSHLSSNTSQDQLNQPKFPFAYQFQTQGIKSDFHTQNKQVSEALIPRHCDIRQSSSSSSIIFPNPLISSRKSLFPDKRKTDEIFSHTESNFTNSPQLQISLDSLSSSTSSTNSHNDFTPTNSSDSIPSNKNTNIPNTNNCWKNIQRALPPPPPSDDQYEYADMKTN